MCLYVYRSIRVHVRVRQPWGRLRLTRECLSFDLFVSQSALFSRPFWSFDDDEAFVRNYHTHHIDGFMDGNYKGNTERKAGRKAVFAWRFLFLINRLIFHHCVNRSFWLYRNSGWKTNIFGKSFFQLNNPNFFVYLS